ncbi:MAG: hypothetical protein ABI580_06895 [Burkholderiaceae bacterium]
MQDRKDQVLENEEQSATQQVTQPCLLTTEELAAVGGGDGKGGRSDYVMA